MARRVHPGKIPRSSDGRRRVLRAADGAIGRLALVAAEPKLVELAARLVDDPEVAVGGGRIAHPGPGREQDNQADSCQEPAMNVGPKKGGDGDQPGESPVAIARSLQQVEPAREKEESNLPTNVSLNKKIN